MAEPNQQFQNTNLQHEDDTTKRLRVGVKNWIAELGRKTDDLDKADLDWLNRVFANISSSLYASKQRKTAAVADDAATVLFGEQDEGGHKGNLNLAIDYLEKASTFTKSAQWQLYHQAGGAEFDNTVDKEKSATKFALVKLYNEAEFALEAALEKTRQFVESKKVAALVESLRKGADILDAAGSDSSMQVAEGIDAVLEAGAASETELVEKLAKVADLFDQEGKTLAAAAMDVIIAQAAEGMAEAPDRWDSRKDLYDAAAHNKETMWEHVKHEVAENRKQHHLEGHRGTAKTLSTRHSPELPGVSMMHVSEGVYQDPVTKKIYDFNKGYTLPGGEKVPGGSVKHQTPNYGQMTGSARMFETRQSRKASAVVPMTKAAIWTSDPMGKTEIHVYTVADHAAGMFVSTLSWFVNNSGTGKKAYFRSPIKEGYDAHARHVGAYASKANEGSHTISFQHSEEIWNLRQPQQTQQPEQPRQRSFGPFPLPEKPQPSPQPKVKQAIKDDALSGGTSMEEFSDPGSPSPLGSPLNRVKPAEPHTKEQIAAMRDWLSDCTWREAEESGETSEEFVKTLSDAEVVSGVKRRYDGGIKQFLEDGAPVKLPPAKI